MHVHTHTHNLVHFTEVLVLWSLSDICSETLVHWTIHREPQQQLHTNRPQVETRELSSREQHMALCSMCALVVYIHCLRCQLQKEQYGLGLAASSDQEEVSEVKIGDVQGVYISMAMLRRTTWLHI